MTSKAYAFGKIIFWTLVMLMAVVPILFDMYQAKGMERQLKLLQMVVQCFFIKSTAEEDLINLFVSFLIERNFLITASDLTRQLC